MLWHRSWSQTGNVMQVYTHKYFDGVPRVTSCVRIAVMRPTLYNRLMPVWFRLCSTIRVRSKRSSNRQMCRLLLGMLGSILFLMNGVFGAAAELDRSSATERKAPKPHIGSAMAVLATLEQAQVLPPENTPAANHVIKSVIQLQSVFTKSDDRFIQAFATRALARHVGDQAAGLMAQAPSAGWTSDLLEALAEAEAEAPAEELQNLAPGLHQFNLSTNDFHQLMQLVRNAQGAFHKQGLTFQQVFASHRQRMPGANVQ